MLTVDHFERIRRMHDVEGLSQRAIARQLGHARKTVAKAVAQPAPPGYRLRHPRSQPSVDPFRAIIAAWLEEDQSRPRKQRHTAWRIFQRLRAEHQFIGGYSTVARYVARARQGEREVFMPLEFSPGEEAQVDWGEGQAIVSGIQQTVQFFCMRLCYSNAQFVYPYRRQNLESFLDGHVRAFAFFGGVPKRLAYDNLKTAVIHVGRGQERTLTPRFLELRSHYLFETRFCNVARGNEKGDVENLVRLVQRSFLTPLPQVIDLAELASQLDSDCRRALEQSLRRDGRSGAELWQEEKARLRTLPCQAFAPYREQSTSASKQALVRFDNNDYSVPVASAYQRCLLRAFVDRLEIACAEQTVAVHPRCYERGQFILDHYVPLLARKPGCLDNARPLKMLHAHEDLQAMRRELEYRYGGAGTRKYIQILLLLQEYPLADVEQAVQDCVRRCAWSDEAVRSLLRSEPVSQPVRLDLSHRPELVHIGSGIRSAALYDTLARQERQEVAV